MQVVVVFVWSNSKHKESVKQVPVPQVQSSAGKRRAPRDQQQVIMDILLREFSASRWEAMLANGYSEAQISSMFAARALAMGLR